MQVLCILAPKWLSFFGFLLLVRKCVLGAFVVVVFENRDTTCPILGYYCGSPLVSHNDGTKPRRKTQPEHNIFHCIVHKKIERNVQ